MNGIATDYINSNIVVRGIAATWSLLLHEIDIFLILVTVLKVVNISSKKPSQNTNLGY